MSKLFKGVGSPGMSESGCASQGDRELKNLTHLDLSECYLLDTYPKSGHLADPTQSP